jgi:hypothetical protein
MSKPTEAELERLWEQNRQITEELNRALAFHRRRRLGFPIPTPEERIKARGEFRPQVLGQPQSGGDEVYDPNHPLSHPNGVRVQSPHDPFRRGLRPWNPGAGPIQIGAVPPPRTKS